MRGSGLQPPEESSLQSPDLPAAPQDKWEQCGLKVPWSGADGGSVLLGAGLLVLTKEGWSGALLTRLSSGGVLVTQLLCEGG